MTTLFPLSELLMTGLFGASLIALLIAPRERWTRFAVMRRRMRRPNS